MTVTVWGWFQSADVNVREEVDTVPSVGSELLTGIVTSPVGREVRTTVKLAVSPVSVVCRFPADVTTKFVCRLPKSMLRRLRSEKGSV